MVGDCPATRRTTKMAVYERSRSRQSLRKVHYEDANDVAASMRQGNIKDNGEVVEWLSNMMDNDNGI